MKRKLLTSVLIFVFFLSSTGIPLVLHTCGISGESNYFGCASCAESTPVTEPESCCDETPTQGQSNSDQVVFFKSLDSETCCYEKVDLHKYNYDISLFGYTQLTANLSGTVTLPFDFGGDNQITQILENCNDLPPPSFGKCLLTSIHQLKIAIPLS